MLLFLVDLYQKSPFDHWKMSLGAVRKLEGKVAVLTASTSGYVVMSPSLNSLSLLPFYRFVLLSELATAWLRKWSWMVQRSC